MEIQKEITLDLLDTKSPALSTTSDIPVVETKPDATPEQKPAPVEAKADEAAVDETKTPEESAPPETPDEDAAANDAPKKAKGVQKRIDELVKQREDAERRAEAERAEKLRLLALVEKGGKPEEKPAEEVKLVRPSRAEFQSDGEYEAALDSYIEAKASETAKREIQATMQAEREKAQREAIERGQREAMDAYKQRVAKAVEKYPDYHAVAESPDVQVSQAMAMAIVQSEYSADLQYYFGKNPAEATRIAALPVATQLKELGKIEARLETPEKVVEKPAEKPKPAVSAAPKPIKPLDAGSDAQVVKTPDEMSMEEYAAWAKERDRKAARPGVR